MNHRCDYRDGDGCIVRPRQDHPAPECSARAERSVILLEREIVRSGPRRVGVGRATRTGRAISAPRPPSTYDPPTTARASKDRPPGRRHRRRRLRLRPDTRDQDLDPGQLRRLLAHPSRPDGVHRTRRLNTLTIAYVVQTPTQPASTRPTTIRPALPDDCGRGDSPRSAHIAPGLRPAPAHSPGKLRTAACPITFRSRPRIGRPRSGFDQGHACRSCCRHRRSVRVRHLRGVVLRSDPLAIAQ